MNNIRARFRELAEHLKNKGRMLNIPAENFKEDILQIVLCPGGHNITVQGLYLANFRYRASLYIERLNLETAVMLMLHARAWLDDYDDTRGQFLLEDPEISIMKLENEEVVDLLLTGDFIDPVYLSPANKDILETEIIEWNGGRYTLSEYDLWIAERGKVNGAPTDI